MITAIDHVVILVKDLDAAIADYSTLGFIVAPGGTHADGATHNALVVFADDSYLELIAFRRPAPEHHWWRHVADGEGLIDFALLPSAIAEDVAAAQARGLALEGPISGGRQRPDGVRVAWQTARPDTPDLPFLCGDVTPRELRVPGGSLREHPNGVAGIAGLAVLTSDLPATAGRYRALLGVDAAGPAFTVGGATILLTQPAADPLPAGPRSGSGGPIALTLRGNQAITFDLAHTHGVPIEVVTT